MGYETPGYEKVRAQNVWKPVTGVKMGLRVVWIIGIASTCTPEGGEKILRRHLPGKVKAPQAEQESILGHFFAGRGRFGGGSSFRRRLKKSSPFWGKSAPRQNPGYAYDLNSTERHCCYWTNIALYCTVL